MDQSREAPPNYVRIALDRFAGYGDRAAITTADRALSYADLRRQIPALAVALRAHGVRPGSTIAVLAGNRPETVLLQFAAHVLGCRTVWVAGYTPVHEQTDYLERAGADFFVYDVDRYRDLAVDLLGRGWSGSVLCLGSGGAGPDLLATASPADGTALDTGDVTTAPASVFYTGGTTGRPKLVLHEHRFFLALLAIGAAWLDSGAPTLRHMALTGFAHVSGQMTNLLMLFTGSTLILRDSRELDIPAWLSTIELERVTSTLVTPVQLYDLLDHPALADADLSSLLLLNVGGGPVFPRRLRQAVERFGPIMRLVYGLSEAAFVTEYRGVTLDPDHPERLHSCGYVFADARVEVRDDDGKPLPAGQVGEVWTTGSLVMSGYWDEPELTRETLVDGWFRTGDLGYLEPDGFLYLVDRSKDMIVTGRGAVNIYTRPVEDALTSHPEVRAAAVIGVPDEALGEAVYAYVVTTPGAAVTVGELRELVATRLNAGHAPSIVEFVDALPLTGMGKADKKALRARHAGAPGNAD